MDKKLLGRFGERVAANFLKNKGYEIIGLNYRTRYGEIDIIASNGRYIVFAEVKLRKNANFANAFEHVDRRKRERIIFSAQLWLSGNETDLQPRFDVIEVYAADGARTAEPKINHIENAFE